MFRKLLKLIAVALVISIATLIIVLTALPKPKSSSGKSTTASRKWKSLQLDVDRHYGGYSLSVDSKGKVIAVLYKPIHFSDRIDDNRIGTFAYQLSKAELRELQQCIAQVNPLALKDHYFPLKPEEPLAERIHQKLYDLLLGSTEVVDETENIDRSAVNDLAGAGLTITTEAGAEKSIALVNYETFPSELAPLFAFRHSGVLGGILFKASQHPLGAIKVRIDTGKKTYRVGEPIHAAIIIENIGTRPVMLPTAYRQSVNSGMIGIGDPFSIIENRNIRAEWSDGKIEWYGVGIVDPNKPASQIDPDRPFVIAPGAAKRITMPIYPPERAPGDYEFSGVLELSNRARNDLDQKNAAIMVSGFIHPDPVHITVIK
jgi:hypothetical protein